jgi:hypothetical protein
MNEDDKIAAGLRTGSAMTTWGILILVGAFLGTCVFAAASVGNNPYGNSAARGVELGQSPWLMLALVAGIALIAVGQAKKANARRASEELFKLRNTEVKVVPDAEAPGGPFRGGMKEVEVLDPTIQAIEKAQREADRRRGNGFLITGGAIMGATVVVLLLMSTGGEPTSRHIENVLAGIGLAFFPFGFGLFFAIKGLLLRSK